MRRIFASVTLAAAFIPACGVPLLFASKASAAGQLLDPGWQLAYVGQSNTGGGLVNYVFGDGQLSVTRASQPAPIYYQPVPVAQPVSVYYPPAPQLRAYQPAPVSYQLVPVARPRAYPSANLYYQSALAVQSARPSYPPSPQARGALYPARAYYQPVLQPQPRTYESMAAYNQQPPGPPPRGAFQFAHVNYQPMPAPLQGNYQAAAQNYQPTPAPQQGNYQGAVQNYQPMPAPQQTASINAPVLNYAPSALGDMAHAPIDPKFERQVVDYRGDEPPGTIIIDTPNYLLYLVEEGGKALRYGIGVGRPGFSWAGVKHVSSMREWPQWRPPEDMLKRRPDLPRYMAGGLENPLGARALYLGSSLYRIHGSNEPWTIGTQVSSGCIRMRNEDVIDLYGRVKIGTKVVVI